MATFNQICAYAGGFAVVLIALSFMWVIIKMGFMNEIVPPPLGLWIGMFLIFGVGLTWLGVNLIVRGTIV